jgi:hypothetical protein
MLGVWWKFCHYPVKKKKKKKVDPRAIHTGWTAVATSSNTRQTTKQTGTSGVATNADARRTTAAATAMSGEAPQHQQQQQQQAALDATLDASWCVWDASGRATTPVVARRGGGGEEESDTGHPTQPPSAECSEAGVEANGSGGNAVGGVVLRATVSTLRQLWTAIGGAVGGGVRSLAVFRLGVRPAPDDPANVRGGVWVC